MRVLGLVKQTGFESVVMLIVLCLMISSHPLQQQRFARFRLTWICHDYFKVVRLGR